jgi:hypothetical protein
MTNRFLTLPLRQKASALVTTLFVVVVLSTIIIAFLKSMSIERQIARSMGNKFQADLAAEAGMQDFLSRLRNITNAPYSACYVLGPNTNPYLFLGRRTFPASGTVAPVVTKRIPLFSTGLTNFDLLTNFTAPFLSTAALSLQDVDRSGSNVARTLSASNDIWCQINKTNAQFPDGLVGLRTTFTNASRPELPVNWLYIKNSTGKVIGRYAFWADDECSKLDIRFAGNADNISGSHTRSNGSHFSDLSLLTLTDLPQAAGANPLQANFANFLAITNSSISTLPLNPTHLQYPLASGLTSLTTNQWRAVKPFVTIYSRHDDRSPDGKRRVNLNALVSSTTSASEIANQTLTIRNAITNNLPKFGERFYSAANGTVTTPTSSHQKAYATRIAANIRDFIDSDNNATIIHSDDTAYVGNRADFAKWEGIDDDLPLAFGKDGGLFLSEYFRVARVIAPTPQPSASTAPITITLRFGHYVELCNISGKTITTADLGSDPHIVLANRSPWQNVYDSRFLRFADVKMRLPANLSIPPSGIVCLTTDGGSFPSGNQTSVMGNATIQLTQGTGPGQWILENTSGTTPMIGGAQFEDYSITTSVTGSNATLRYEVYNTTPDDKQDILYTDQRERLIFANNSGIFDSAFRIYSTLRRYLKPSANPIWVNTYLNDSESETGNNTPTGDDKEARYTRGDLRSNCDIISYNIRGTGIVWKQAGDGVGTNLYSISRTIQQQTLGDTNYEYDKLPTYRGNLVSAWRKGWYEFTSDPAGNHFVKNTNLTSLAELGYVYDPVRYDIEGYRSMGATLRIGQSDSATNNRATNADADYQNWLGGRGSDSATDESYGKNAFLLMDVFRTDTNTAGRINPNSVVRDGFGTVMRAALTNFVYEGQATNGASTLLGNQTLNPTNTVAAIRDFATNSTHGFLVSVGDLSRIPAFWGNGTSSTNIVPGVAMSAVSDAGKEEFLRRTANLLTTQSLAYTVYIVGQTGEILNRGGTDTFVPASTTTTETVIQLEPVYPATSGETPVFPSEWRTLTPRSITY